MIRCKGRKHQVYINGILVSEYLEKADMPTKGFIAFQISGDKEEAQFQDITIREL